MGRSASLHRASINRSIRQRARNWFNLRTWLPASLCLRSRRLFSLRMCDSSLECASGMCCATASKPQRLASFSTIQRTCMIGRGKQRMHCVMEICPGQDQILFRVASCKQTYLGPEFILGVLRPQQYALQNLRQKRGELLHRQTQRYNLRQSTVKSVAGIRSFGSVGNALQNVASHAHDLRHCPALLTIAVPRKGRKRRRAPVFAGNQNIAVNCA